MELHNLIPNSTKYGNIFSFFGGLLRMSTSADTVLGPSIGNVLSDYWAPSSSIVLPALAPLSLECFLFPDQALVPGRRIAPLGPRASLPAFLMLLHSVQHKLGPIGEISFLSVPHHAPVLLPSSVYTVYAQPCMCSAW